MEAAAGSGSTLPEGAGAVVVVVVEVSGPIMAPGNASPPAAICSASSVGEEGGEGRAFFLLEDSSFSRPFFSRCKEGKRPISRLEDVCSPQVLMCD